MTSFYPGSGTCVQSCATTHAKKRQKMFNFISRNPDSCLICTLITHRDKNVIIIFNFYSEGGGGGMCIGQLIRIYVYYNTSIKTSHIIKRNKPSHLVVFVRTKSNKYHLFKFLKFFIWHFVVIMIFIDWFIQHVIFQGKRGLEYP